MPPVYEAPRVFVKRPEPCVLTYSYNIAILTMSEFSVKLEPDPPAVQWLEDLVPDSEAFEWDV